MSSLYQSHRSRLPPLPQTREAGGAHRQKRRKVIERELKIKTLADGLAYYENIPPLNKLTLW